MKKSYLLLFTILSSFVVAVAQPTLTRANFMPVAGDAQLFYVADTNSVLDNMTGPNVVFNYNDLRGYGQTQTQEFVSVASTGHSLDFPTATFADTTVGFAGNMKFNEDFTDSLNIVGLALEINSFGSVIAKFDSDPEKLMVFPFTYGDSFNDSYGGQFTSSVAPVATNGNGTTTVTADAWGTLKLPMTPDIDSVLRVVRVENLLTDTIFLQPILPDILPIPVNATQISYYKPSISKHPLLSFVIGDVNGDTTINVVSQYPMFGVGIEEVNKNVDISIYPNPANNNQTTITFNLEDKARGNISIFNNLGQNVLDVFNGKLQKGKNKYKINTTKLSKGLYFVNINIDSNVITKKLVIE